MAGILRPWAPPLHTAVASVSNSTMMPKTSEEVHPHQCVQVAHFCQPLGIFVVLFAIWIVLGIIRCGPACLRSDARVLRH